jgi:hypothetical protein
MLGKIAVLCALVSCAHNVGQDEHTGPDGKELGAKPIVLDNNEGKAHGVVTYPGGDRTDWKLVELPDKKVGTLEFQLQWQPPRPGLQLAFDVFDQYNTPVTESKKTSKKRSASRVRTASIDNAKGKYFVRVYAVDRGDAGAYKLTVNFTELLDPKTVPVDIPLPPKLAEIPTECGTFDKNNVACADVCTADSPPGWKACIGKCPKDDVANSACWPTMKCPTPPDTRVKDCTPNHWPACDRVNASNPLNVGNPNCNTPPPPPPPKTPLLGRVMKNELTGDDVFIYVSVAQKVTPDWTIYVLSGDTNSKLAKVVFVRMLTDKTMLGRVHLKPDVVNANLNVRFEPPP